MTRSLATTLLAALLALAGAPSALAHQEQPAPDEQPAEETTAETEGEEDMPSLDDLLGIPEEERPIERPSGAENVEDALDPDKAELERALSGEQVSEMFSQAIQQMGDAAELLERGRDPGVRTQRIHEDILRKLDVLIEQAEQNQSSSSSSSSSSQQQQQQQQQASQPQQQQGQQTSDSRPGDPQEANTPPGRQEGPLADVLDAAQAAWGSLPARVRESLVQGLSERLSDQYRSLTEEYYRRLAEENDQR